ncbi:hypothetical protein ACHAXR_011605 [Thalassiosira sp. AJA248-18]
MAALTMCLHVDLPSWLNSLMGKSTAEAPPLTPEDIVKVLQDRGWEAEIVKAASMPDIKPINPKGILKCVDGRGSDNTAMQGPKMPGGIYAIAHNRGTTSIDGLKAITKEVINAGHVPSVHGDTGGMLGCGFFRLWVTGEFDDMGYPRPEYDADQGKHAVEEAGGTIEMHHGSHTEQIVLINLVENKTFEPDENDQRFIVDGWAAGKFGLDVPKFLVGAAATVEMLNGPKKAKIVIP